MERGKTLLAVPVAAWWVMGLSCSLRESPPPAHESVRDGPARTATQGLSDPGIEKLIPLRFINLKSCEPGPLCPDNSNYSDILRAVDAANEVFKAAAVQFWPKSIERYHTPTLANLRSQTCGGTGDVLVRWDTIRAELQLPFPSMPSNAWQDGDEKWPRWWLRSANTIYCSPDELIVWLVEGNRCPPDEGHNGVSPYEGRNLFFVGSGMGDPFKLAHELGHNLGLVHTWVGPLADAQTLHQGVKSDVWDLVYKPNGGQNGEHLFFSNKTDAQDEEASLALIEANGNCTIDLNGIMSCDIPKCTQPCYTELHTTGDDALKGMAFSFAGGQVGTNLMSYVGLTGARSKALGDSQIETARKFLRWSVQVSTYDTDKMRPGAVLSSRIPRLGSWNLRQVGAKLDFDLDGKRDIGVWEPPTMAGVNGTFTVLLSSKGFSTSAGQYMSVQLGQLGDVPVPANFSGDGRTDLAVYQPGGGQNRNDPTDTHGWWRWCPTAAAAETTTCVGNELSTQWGYREDVPLPGLSFNGTSTPLVTTFRPTGGVWSWRTVSGGLGTTRSLGGPGSVLLPGDYDTDFLTDIAVYRPEMAHFQLLRSEQSWNTLISRSFGSKFIPADSGSEQDRSAALPLSGVYRPRTICAPICLSYPRRVFSLWFPYDGTWTTMWEPLTGSTLDTCQWGIGNMDMPMTDIDRNGDKYTDMAVYRGAGWSDPGWFHFKNSTPSVPNSCTGSTASVYYAYGSGIRQRVVGVADMTGDGKAEILLVDPEYGTIQWMTSESGYMTVYSRSIGSQRAIIL